MQFTKLALIPKENFPNLLLLILSDFFIDFLVRWNKPDKYLD